MEKNVNEKYTVALQDVRLWFVEGADKFKGLTFALCTTKEKAEAAKKLVDENLGTEGTDSIVIRHSTMALDTLDINGFEFIL